MKDRVLKQTDLMDWIKAEHVEFFAELYPDLASNFNYWGIKQQNGEYVWFCSMNESCQAGYIISYIQKLPKKSYQESVDVIKSKCLEILGL